MQTFVYFFYTINYHIGSKNIKNMKTILSRLRKNAGFSQSVVAAKLGISRPTYVAIEKGEKEMTLTEIKNISQVFGIREQDLLESKKQGPEKSSMNKFKQVLFNCIKFGADEDGKITKTKLAKLVYLCDFASFYTELEPMTGFEYRKLAQGPVTMEFFSVIDEDPSLELEQKGRAMMVSLIEGPSTSELSADELTLIKKICKKWRSHNTQEIVDFTHKQMPWFACHENEVIPYSLIHTEDPDNIY